MSEISDTEIRNIFTLLVYHITPNKNVRFFLKFHIYLKQSMKIWFRGKQK